MYMKKMYAIILTVVLTMMTPLTALACETAPTQAPADPTVAAPTEVAPPITTDGTVPTPAETAALVPTAPEGAVPALIVVHRVSCKADVYDKDNLLIKELVVSTGREGHRTPLGDYKIYEHSTGSGYHLMVDGTYGRWCMRFKKGGYMFHSVCYAKSGDAEPIQEEVDALGTRVSRGCVRLSVADAEWLYNATPKGCAVSVVDD